MGVLFSKSRKTKSRITEVDRQVLTLKLQRDQLVVFRRKLDVQYTQAENAVKMLLRDGRKSLALLALKRRKHQGELIHQAEEHLLRVNELISNVEMASIQSELVKALAAGNSALKSIQSEVSVGYVEQLLDENSELQSQVTDISDLLSGVKAEDPDLFDEYERLEAEVALDKTSAMPNVPSSTLPEVLTSVASESVKSVADSSVAEIAN